jgi:N utilization substance protein A
VAAMTTATMVVLGENGIKTLEDLAGCVTDDLVGWTERKKDKDAEPIRHKGILDGFDVARKDVEEMIMSARVLLGWIKPEDLAPAAEPAEAGDASAVAVAEERQANA